MPAASADWCRTLGNYTPPRSLRGSVGVAAGAPLGDSSMTTSKIPRLPDPRLPNPNVTALQRRQVREFARAAALSAAFDAGPGAASRDAGVAAAHETSDICSARNDAAVAHDAN